MNELQIFNSEEFGEIRTITKDNEPWFVASDICRSLDLSNPTMAMQRIDDDEKAKFNLGLSGGETNCVNEYGLYSLVLASRKREAKDFKRWITHEVIPSIRKNGGYIAGQETLSDEELLSKALMVAQRKIDEKNNTNFLQTFACGYANPEYEKRKFTRTDLLSATDTIGVKHPFYAIVSCHVLL